MKRILEWMDVAFDKNTKEDWDTVWIITGDEGTGKSHLGLHLIEHWYTKLLGNVNDDLIKFVALDMEGFVTGLKDLKKYYMMVYDEAGELSNHRQMNKFNYTITQGYQVIRGENLMTVLILPSVFDLNPFFTTRRARALLHVYKRGKFAFWNKPKLRNIIETNRNYRVRKVWRTKPLFLDTYPKYNGKLMEAYKNKKNAKMEQTRKKLYDNIMSETNPDRELLLLKRAKEQFGVDETCKLFGISKPTVYRRLEKLQVTE